MTRTGLMAAIAAASLAGAAVAQPTVLYPVQTGAEQLRFQIGVPTLNLETPNGGVQITPLPFDHGHIAFRVGVYNKGYQPTNFGIENITATINGAPVAVLSSTELQKRAKSRAMWSQIGIAVLAGAAAAAASQAYTTNTYRGVVHTPHGTYAWASSYRDNSLGVLGAATVAAGGAAGIVGVQNRLDYTLAHLATEVVQTTTIDPDASYGGRVVIEKDDRAKLPYDVRLVMTLNGVGYPFTFRVTKEGANLPPPFTAPVVPVAAVVPAAAAGAADAAGGAASPPAASPPAPVPPPVG